MGRFDIMIKRASGKIEQHSLENTIPEAAVTALLDYVFLGGPSQHPYFMGLIAVDNFTGTSVLDTGAGHSGWEELTSYSASSRPSVGFASTFAAGNSNRTALIGTPLTFPNGLTRIKGFFVINSSVKGGSSGLLLGVTAYGPTDLNGVGYAVIHPGDELYPRWTFTMRTELRDPPA